ncbi:hypothetical protein VNI00_000616 [Paramarasmius palmivorus]|uniref:F-box domain-containing protein n=1 Tax=Paramarasmius palmivorus TaxID=297713 RepID=A0AAW0EBL4_9AGAR
MSRMEEKQAKLVELYLTNSAQHPLKIFLHEHARYAWSDDEDIDDTMGITGFNVFCSVIAELHRCREFHYAVSSGGLLGEVGRERVVWGFNVPEARWFWNLVKNSPNLINLAVNGLKDNWRYPRSLQILKISYQENYSSLFEVLSYLPNLKTLHLHTIYSRESPVFRLAEPLSIGLRDVTITTPGQLERLTLLFDSLILPTLSSLTILTCQQFSFPDEVPTTNQSDSDVTSYRDNQLTALHALVQRSACTLRELTLYVEPFSSADILSILELQPSLTGLELEIRVPRTQTPSLSSVLVDLCARMSHPGSPLLPNLRRLSIHETLYVDYREYDINDALCHAACVVDMLESRELGRSGEAPRVTEVMLKFGRVVPLGYATTVQSEYKIPVDLVRRVQALEEKRIRCHITLPIMVEGESFRDEE